MKGSRKQAVLRLLSDYCWHSTAEVNAVDVGGSEGTRRLRELRESGHKIVRRKQEDSDQFEYRLLSESPVAERGLLF